MRVGSLLRKQTERPDFSRAKYGPLELGLVDFISTHQNEPALSVFFNDIAAIQVVLENKDILRDAEIFSQEEKASILTTGFCHMIANYALNGDYFIYDNVDLCQPDNEARQEGD